MAKDEIILRTELEIARTKTNIKKLKKEMEGLDMRFTESKQKALELEFQEQKLAKSKQVLAKRNKELSISQSELGRSTGAATSAALELGRVISDAPYGIRGMANNVSQLVSQFSFMSTAVDQTTGKVVGFNGALKNFGRAIKANAVLLLIQGVISALDYFAGSTSKAEKEFNSFSDTVSSGFTKVAKIEALSGIMSDVNSSISQQKEALDDLKKLGFDPANQSINDFIDNQKKLVVINAGVKAIEGQLKKIYVERLELFSKFREEYANLLRIQREGYGGEDISKAVLEQLKLDKVELDKKEADLKKELQRLIKRSLDFDVDEIKKDGKKVKVSPFKTKKELEIDIKSNEQALINYSKQIEIQNIENARDEKLLTAKTEKEKNEIKRSAALDIYTIQAKSERDSLELKKKNEIAVVKSKYDTFKTESELALKLYEQKINLNDKLTSSQKKSAIEAAKARTAELISDAEIERDTSLDEIESKYRPLFDLMDKLHKSRLLAFGIKSDDEEFDALNHYIKSYKTLMSGLTQFIDGEFQRQLTLEQDKTNALNEELNNRLLNENLSKDERARIQNEIWQNDENLRKKQNEIKKKQFNTQKAFNITMATVDTYSAATKVLNDPALTGNPFARFSLAAATVVSGLAQVAMIARQKFQPEAASTPIRTASGGGGGGGVGDRSFNFNLVGASQQNQLVNAIQSQFDKPLKAYVVSKDITNQQQLDANTRATARFGG